MRKRLFICSCCFFLILKTNCQISIVGATCVLTGQEYQYNIQGNLSEGAQLCINGGKIVGSSSTCITNLSSGYVRVVWTGSKGSITLTSSGANFSQQINVTTPLQGGTITSSTKKQFIGYEKSPSNISCTAPTGGACTASYVFQWQQSLDNLNWQNITGAMSQNLASISSLTQTTFFRRKTIDNNSGSIVYSDEAVVFVAVDTKGH